MVAAQGDGAPANAPAREYNDHALEAQARAVEGVQADRYARVRVFDLKGVDFGACFHARRRRTGAEGRAGRI